MPNVLEFLGSIFLLVITIFAAIFCIAYGIGRFECNGFEFATGYRTQYAGFDCYALVDGKWVPKDYVFGKKINANVKSER